jgi:dihydroorotate dehydrogenase electron transfer subunit
MPVQTECRVLSCKSISRYAYDMLLGAGEIAAAAQPGQFVNVACGAERILRRPISVCAAGGGTLRLVFEVRGEGTKWLSERAEGDAVNVLGPLGHGFDIKDRRVLFVGGGVGVPPLLAAAAGAASADAVLGFRNAAHAMLTEDFKAVCKNVEIMTDDGSLGTKGVVTVGMEKLLRDNAYDAVCACGPRVMLRAAASVAAAEQLPCQVSMEERMGCGIGACLVCACMIRDEKTGEDAYRHVCKDGPVFDAREVVWE